MNFVRLYHISRCPVLYDVNEEDSTVEGLNIRYSEMRNRPR